ncbi:cold-responsive protein kinase 1 isoform X2 [Cryptomeria japonica]|uniref:cold-responsive protein kinase 1 isoform X2 n=1 Tax=Cryptomeria japonica TaxID=3369 RepID=UPI0025AD4D50|nr:cold-responsive protein kinase 1 isoform X2 [Cryptomeria japonica]XP_057842053.1 cold-responsive protein kinase 1 isoform X2 [Cryptomeria japonica]
MFASLNCCGAMSRGNKQSQTTVGESGEDFSIIQGVHVFSYKDLTLATKNFHPGNQIGAGGFGTVYKGVLKDGTEVAVKKLSVQSRQGVHEFLTEIETISAIKHENVVMLHGCCVEEDHRILVYGYLENNSISQALFGSSNGAINLDWQTRSKICIGSARGFAYLHEEVTPHIVHRDIKASNILLDGDLNPKIADFGLAKLFPDNMTHVSTRVAGTLGYLAPEYAMCGQLTRKADVYSFGVLLLEIISGRVNINTTLPVEEKILLKMAWRLYEENRLLELVDTRLEKYSEEEALRFIKVALLCTQAAPKNRPIMSQVVKMLSEGHTFTEKSISRPAFMSADLKILPSHESTTQTSRLEGESTSSY